MSSEIVNNTEELNIDLLSEYTNIVDIIRAYAEETHCPSEVLAVERWIQDRRKKRYFINYKNIEVEPADDARRLIDNPSINDSEESFNESDDYLADDLSYIRQQADALVKMSNPNVEYNVPTQSSIRLRFLVAEDTRPYGACLYVFEQSDTEWFVVLPKDTQEKVTGGEACSEISVKAKDTQRRHTMHELAHVLIREYEKGKGNAQLNSIEHRYAKELEDTMIYKKMVRNEEIRTAQLQYPESELSKSIKRRNTELGK